MGEKDVCLVCGRPVVEGPGHGSRGRSYCREHYALVHRATRGVALPLLLEVGLLIVFVAVVSILASLVHPRLGGPGLVLVGTIIALVPAAIWLIAFYQEDQQEREPKRLVLAVFLFAALLAQGVGQPLIHDVFQVQTWPALDPLTTILEYLLVAGMIQSFLQYAAVRYTVYYAAEFDEKMEGVIYGAAAGLGYATLMNIQYVVSNGGVDPGVGAIRVAVIALAHGSLGAVLGYFIGRAKFERVGPLWLPAGLLLTATLNGLITYGVGAISVAGGMAFTPWYGLGFALLVAAIIYWLSFTAMRRHNAEVLGSIG